MTERQIVAVAGGSRPVRSRNGQRLLYQRAEGPGGTIVSADLAGGRPRTLLDLEPVLGSDYFLRLRPWDVTSDGDRFLVVKMDRTAPASQEITVIENWLAALTRAGA